VRGLTTLPKCHDQIEKSPSASENAKRRRQQNRNSQVAFRERNRTNLKKLQEELTQSQSENEELYSIMEQLLERTEHIKRSIEDVLTSRYWRGLKARLSALLWRLQFERPSRTGVLLCLAIGKRSGRNFKLEYRLLFQELITFLLQFDCYNLHYIGRTNIQNKFVLNYLINFVMGSYISQLPILWG
jgi:hypothetical protein